jgi:hypothetical protein
MILIQTFVKRAETEKRNCCRPSGFRHGASWNPSVINQAVDAGYRFLYNAIPMKTTLDLRDDLLARAKELAAKKRTSLTKVIEESLTLRLRSRQASRRKLNELPVSVQSGGLRKGIDGTSNRSLFDAADA